MSRTSCQINGRHLNLEIVLDDDGNNPVAVRCTDWECGQEWRIANLLDQTLAAPWWTAMISDGQE